MKKAMLAAAAAAVWAGPAAALVEPSASGKVAEVKPDERDGRIRTVEYERGAVIRVVLSRGRATMVELPEGQEIDTFLASDQDVMDNTPPPEEERGNANRGTGGNGQQGGPTPCSLSANLQICVRRDRFIAFKPITELDPQPVHVVALRLLPSGKVSEVPYLFQLETEGRVGAPPAKVAGGEVPAPAHYYAVRVVMPQPQQQPQTAVPRRPRGPSLARTQPQNLPAAAAPPLNNAYELQGDRGLVGAAR